MCDNPVKDWEHIGSFPLFGKGTGQKSLINNISNGLINIIRCKL